MDSLELFRGKMYYKKWKMLNAVVSTYDYIHTNINALQVSQLKEFVSLSLDTPRTAFLF